MRKTTLLFCIALAGCASDIPPTRIGAETYYSAAQNKLGMYGDPQTVAGQLMAQGNEFCSRTNKEFELVTQSIEPVRIGSAGGASITFKCVDHAGIVDMRPDNGVSTIQTK